MKEKTIPQKWKIERPKNSIPSRELSIFFLFACFNLISLHDWWSLEHKKLFTISFSFCFFALALSSLIKSFPHGHFTDISKNKIRWITVLISSSLCIACYLLILFPHYQNKVSVLSISTLTTVYVAISLLILKPKNYNWLSTIACLLLLYICSKLPYQGMVFFPHHTWHLKTIITISYIAIIGWNLTNLHPGYLLLITILSSTALRIEAIHQWPINGFIRDMLPLIESALTSFFHGENPYRIYFLTHEVPLTYLPGMWLSYAPAYILKVDLRWINILLLILCCYFIYKWGKKEKPFAITMAIILSLQSEIFWNTIHGEPPVYWFWLCMFITSLSGSFWIVPAVMLGVAMATRHFALLLVPFIFTYLRVRGLSYGKITVYMLTSFAVAILITIPFIIWNPDSFFYGTYKWLATYGSAYRELWKYQIGFQSFFYAHEKENLLPILQILIYTLTFITSILLCVKAGKLENTAPKIAGIMLSFAYMGGILTAQMIWKSFLVAPLVILVGFALHDVPKVKWMSFPRWFEKRKFTTIVVPSALMLINLVGIALTFKYFIRFHDKSDIVKFTDKIMPYVNEADLIIDKSYFNAFHVFEGSSFRGTTVERGKFYTMEARTTELAKFKKIALLDGYSIYTIEDSFPDLLSGFKVKKMIREGRSSFYLFESKCHPCKEKWRLKNHLNFIEYAEFSSEKPPTITGKLSGNKFNFTGIPPWIYAGKGTCTIFSTDYEAITVRLIEAKDFFLKIKIPVKGQLWLFSAIEDTAFVRPLKPIKIKTSIGGRKRNIIQSAERGLFSWYLGQVSGEELKIKFTRDRKTICFDVAVY